MSKKTRSIDQYAFDKKRSGCVVCKVPAEIRAQIAAARKRRYTVQLVLDWLKSEHKIVLTAEQMRHHYGGLHEGRGNTIRR